MNGPEDVPNSGTADALDALFRARRPDEPLFPPRTRGSFHSTEFAQDMVPEGGRSNDLADEGLQSRLDGHMRIFFIGINPDWVKNTPRREVVGKIREKFDGWKNMRADEFSKYGTTQADLTAIRALTLSDLENHAKERFSDAKKSAAILPLNSPEQLRARKESDYWSIMDEIMREAKNPDR